MSRFSQPMQFGTNIHFELPLASHSPGKYGASRNQSSLHGVSVCSSAPMLAAGALATFAPTVIATARIARHVARRVKVLVRRRRPSRLELPVASLQLRAARAA